MLLMRDAKGFFRPAGAGFMTANSATMTAQRRGLGTPVDLPVLDVADRPMGTFFLLCAALYLGIYALEAPVRYVLYLEGKDNFILARDGLIFGSLALLVFADALKLRLHPAFLIFGALTAFHGLVLIGTVGSGLGAAYGVKIVINLLFGFFVAERLLYPGSKLLGFLVLLWIVTIVGVCLDKFVMTFPWTGIKTIVGDLNVDVSKDWEITNEVARRAAGFTRSSISSAVLLPLLGIVLMCRARNFFVRAGFAIGTLGADFLTTQKGSIAAFAPVAAVLCLERLNRILLLRLLIVTFAMAAVGLPFLLIDLHFGQGSGVFSMQSLDSRVSETWPEAWNWIQHRQLFAFGVGLGGIGGPQRIYAPGSFNPADNFFILLFAFFGVFGILYLLILCLSAMRRVTGSPARMIAALAIVAFLLGYGAVLSILEDQAATLFLGAAIGVIVVETRTQERAARMPLVSAVD